MKKPIIALAIVIALATPAWAQLRLDAGFDSPFGFGGSLTEGAVLLLPDDDIPLLLPVPDFGLYYQLDRGAARFGIGLRFFTVIVASAVFPNVFVEIDRGRFILEAQLGGGYALVSGIFGPSEPDFFCLVPDFSAWIRIGRKAALRIGLGIAGAYAPELLGDDLYFISYIGGKAAIPL